MKTIKTVLFLTALALAVSTCTRKAVVQPRFGEVALDTLLDNSAAECRIEYDFASILNAADSPALQAIEEANIGYFFQLEDFTGDARQAVAVSVHETAAAFLSEQPGTGAAGRSYEFSVQSEGAVVDTLLSYVISRWSYTGGAHGMYGIECHTYSLAEGYELTAEELFGRERLPRIDSLIRRKIYENYEAADDEQLSALGFFPDEIALTENFRITGDGVVFHYNPYEIGCYALGPVEVEIGREEIEGL